MYHRGLGLSLIALAITAGTEGVWACEKGGGSATFARRPSMPVPMMSVASAGRYYPPPVRPPIYNYFANPLFNYGVNPNYFANPGNQYQPTAFYNNDLTGGYSMTPTAPSAGYSSPVAAAAPVQPRTPARIIAPSLPPQQEAVALPAGTNRMRYVAVSVAGMGSNSADKLEQELGKLAGVRGVNVKRDTVKVWFNDKEPVHEKDVLAELQKLGFTATLVEGS